MELNIEPLLGQRAAEDRARLLAQIRQSPSVSAVLSYLSQQVPDLANIPQATYTLYRQFEHTGFRRGYEKIHFARRSMLTRAVLEFIMGDDSRRDIIHDLLWSICEETSWVLPAHEEQGPDFWELKPSPRASHCASHCASQSPRSSEGPYFGESPRTFALRIPILGTEGPYFGECPRSFALRIPILGTEGHYFGECPRSFALRIPILGTEGPDFGDLADD
jgi:hypothetical protein